MDERVHVLTDKAVGLAQLDAELGAYGLCASSIADLTTEGVAAKVVVADGSPVTQAELDSAVAAHAANPDFGKAESQKNVEAVREKAEAVLAGTDTFTSAQVQKLLASLVLRRLSL